MPGWSRKLNALLNKPRFLAGDYMQSIRNGNKDFTIISNDCWGGEVYKNLRLEYKTPFVGLMVMAPCYIKMLSRLEYYLSQPLIFSNHSKYPDIMAMRQKKYFPIGYLDDVEVCFYNDVSEEEVKKKWERRLKRINWDNLFIKFDGGKGFSNDDLLKKFTELPFEKKICFINKETENTANILYMDDWEYNGLNMYRKSLKYFDVVGWINNSSTAPDLFYKIYYHLLLKRIQ